MQELVPKIQFTSEIKVRFRSRQFSLQRNQQVSLIPGHIQAGSHFCLNYQLEAVSKTPEAR